MEHLHMIMSNYDYDNPVMSLKYCLVIGSSCPRILLFICLLY